MESYHAEEGGDMFSETSGITRATQCNSPQDNSHCYRLADDTAALATDRDPSISSQKLQTNLDAIQNR
jgi:hypothetical protein